MKRVFLIVGTTLHNKELPVKTGGPGVRPDPAGKVVGENAVPPQVVSAFDDLRMDLCQTVFLFFFLVTKASR